MREPTTPTGRSDLVTWLRQEALKWEREAQRHRYTGNAKYPNTAAPLAYERFMQRAANLKAAADLIEAETQTCAWCDGAVPQEEEFCPACTNMLAVTLEVAE